MNTAATRTPAREHWSIATALPCGRIRTTLHDSPLWPPARGQILARKGLGEFQLLLDDNVFRRS